MFQMAVFCFAQRKRGAGQKPKFTGEERVREALGVSLCSQSFRPFTYASGCTRASLWGAGLTLGVGPPAAAHGLRCPGHQGSYFPDIGLNPCLLPCEADS